MLDIKGTKKKEIYCSVHTVFHRIAAQLKLMMMTFDWIWCGTVFILFYFFFLWSCLYVKSTQRALSWLSLLPLFCVNTILIWLGGVKVNHLFAYSQCILCVFCLQVCFWFWFSFAHNTLTFTILNYSKRKRKWENWNKHSQARGKNRSLSFIRKFREGNAHSFEYI